MLSSLWGENLNTDLADEGLYSTNCVLLRFFASSAGSVSGQSRAPRRAITVAVAPGGSSVPVPDLRAVPVPLEVIPAAVVAAAQRVSHFVHSPAYSLTLKKFGHLEGIIFAEPLLQTVHLFAFAGIKLLPLSKASFVTASLIYATCVELTYFSVNEHSL